MQFNGPVTYTGHLKSEKHQKKASVQKQLEMLSIGGATASRSIRSGVAAACPPTVSTSLQVDPLRFACSLCNVTMNSPDTMAAHNQVGHSLFLQLLTYPVLSIADAGTL